MRMDTPVLVRHQETLRRTRKRKWGKRREGRKRDSKQTRKLNYSDFIHGRK